MRDNRIVGSIHYPAIGFDFPVDEPLVEPVNGFNDTLMRVDGASGKDHPGLSPATVS